MSRNKYTPHTKYSSNCSEVVEARQRRFEKSQVLADCAAQTKWLLAECDELEAVARGDEDMTPKKLKDEISLIECRRLSIVESAPGKLKATLESSTPEFEQARLDWGRAESAGRYERERSWTAELMRRSALKP